MRKVDYLKLPQEKKTKTLMLRLTPSTFKQLKISAIQQHRRAGELARVLVEQGLNTSKIT